MSVIVVAEFPTTEQGAQDFIDWSKRKLLSVVLPDLFLPIINV